MANNYINNTDFFNALIQYKAECDEAKLNGIKCKPIPEYIGECFMDIAEHLSRKPNFASYSFREEMVSDGIENCLMYFRNFDPEKSKNPFAYFTQITYFAFLRRISKEKQELYIKYKATEQVGILDENEQLNGIDGHMKQFEVYSNISEFIHNFEESKRKKKVIPIKGIENFITEENINE
ncbi:sigma factor for late transcription [Candidatus Dojkabacteria bacterium]|jgi:hypothetical protein|nr:sigma factor for late transcription [Candidatus Dojkabacteria bacterium]